MAVLKNFCTINPAIIFYPGDKVRTASEEGDIFAEASIEKVPAQFGVFSLPNLLAVLGLYQNPTMLIEDGKRLWIEEDSGGRRFFFTLSTETYLRKAARVLDNMNLEERFNAQAPDLFLGFKLSSSDLQACKQNMTTVGMPEAFFTGRDGRLLLRGTKRADPTFHSYEAEIGKIDRSLEFNLTFTFRKLQCLMDNDYLVDIAKNIIRFKTEKLTYYISPELETT